MSFSGRHGVGPAEREHAQRFKVDIEADVELSEAARTDQLTGTIDYRKMRAIVQPRDRVERTLPDLRAAIAAAEIPDEVKRPALGALERLGRAEARLHDRPESQLHLHELGGADTLVDLVGAFWLLHNLGVEQVYASILPAPSGLAGQMPLPGPASVRVLEGTGAKFRATDETRELVTPPGAAILAVAAKFSRPAMSLQSIGYGIGARDVPGNALAVWIGDEVLTQTG